MIKDQSKSKKAWKFPDNLDVRSTGSKASRRLGRHEPSFVEINSDT